MRGLDRAVSLAPALAGLGRGACAFTVSVAAALLVPGAGLAALSCVAPYSYAGLVHERPAHGVAATLTALTPPTVGSGHVGAWVGVGGPGAGPNGESEWIQVGYSGFDGGENELYYEVTRPGSAPRYTTVKRGLRAGERHRVAVVEVRGRPDWWHVRVDGKTVSRRFFLPGSHRAWRPMAMAESWNAGTSSCNGFRYRFEQVEVSIRPGGVWRRFKGTYVLQDRGYRVVQRHPAGFLATATR